ncbi:MAG: hypothetical protein OQJ77_02580 [Thiovulaceae bacterium]|nr:hypothetical protein [Sulfurimonadaceae bacterium]
MKYIVLIFLLAYNLMAYEFVLVNSTEIDDQNIIDRIENQIKNYYYSEENEIIFKELDDKEAVLEILDEYDYSGDVEEQEQLIQRYEDSQEDLQKIFSTKYILIVREKINRDNRKELEIVLKVDNLNYFDGTFVMPNIDEKELHYVDTITNVVLTYLVYKDKNFIKVHQL